MLPADHGIRVGHAFDGSIALIHSFSAGAPRII
jgi:hypothetical protein